MLPIETKIMGWGSTLLYGACWVGVGLAFLWVGLSVLSGTPPPEPPEVSRGSGFQTTVEGVEVLHLDGDPYSLGYYHSTTLPSLLNTSESAFDDLFESLVDRPLLRAATRLGLRFLLRSLSSKMTPEELLEARGMIEIREDHRPDLGPLFFRALSYPALYDLYPGLPANQRHLGASLVAVRTERGRDHRSYLARNLDLNDGSAFDRNKVLFAVKPTDRFGYVSLGWAGFLGAVSGINEHGLAVVLNPAPTRPRLHQGIPTPLLGRRLLTQTRTVEGAIALLVRTPSRGHQIIGLSDATGNTAVVELTPSQIGVRRGEVLGATNHFETPALEKSASNAARRTQSTSLPRRQRLATLLGRLPDRIGPPELASLLRDRVGASGRLLPLGHRHSINAMTAIQSVIFDSTSKRVWVNQGPHTSGAYVGFDVLALIAASDASEVTAARLPGFPPAALLTLESSAQVARENLRAASKALDEGLMERAQRHLAGSAPLNDHPVTLTLRGRLAQEQGEPEWALEFYRQALLQPVEYASEESTLKAAVERLNRSIRGAQGRGTPSP